MLNIWELSKSRLRTKVRNSTLTLTDTTLHYGQPPTGATDDPDSTSLVLPAIAFVFATDRGIKEIRSFKAAEIAESVAQEKN